MSAFPGSPRLVKGAIVGVDVFNPLASIIVFQYNPKTLTRRLERMRAAADDLAGETVLVVGYPTGVNALLAKADHDSRLREHRGIEFLDPLEQAQRVEIARAGADVRVQARNGFQIVVEHVGPRATNLFDRRNASAEVGRQPWIVYGLMKTSDAVSPVAASQVLTTLIAFIVLYSLLGVTGFYLIAKNALKGPELTTENE